MPDRKNSDNSNSGNIPAPVLVPGGWTYSPVPALDQAIAEVRRRHGPLLPSGLDRTRRLLQKLGNPQTRMPPVFHAAGTNGKGSTLAFVQAALEAGGLCVHKYISPHLVRFEERITVAGQRISPDLLLDLIGEVDRAAGEDAISFFEFFTALGFLAWARQPADALLLETGLGGTFDATNVLDGGVPSGGCVTLLTRISFDHTHILGKTLPEIAVNKAGIIKPGCPVLVAPQADAAVNAVFAARTQEVGAPLYEAGRDWTARVDGHGFVYEDDGMRLALPLPALQGAHQVDNAGTAIAALRRSPFAPLATSETLEKAMTAVRWPGRMQRLETGALAALLPPGWELWVDGAHNDSGAAALVEQARAWGPEKPLHVIASFKRRKETAGFLRPLLGVPRTLTAVEAEFDAPMVAADALREEMRALGFPGAQAAPGLESAIRSLVFQFDTPQRILIAGSLYLVGHALRLNNT